MAGNRRVDREDAREMVRTHITRLLSLFGLLFAVLPSTPAAADVPTVALLEPFHVTSECSDWAVTDGRYLAWLDGFNCSDVRVADLDSGQIQTVAGGDGLLRGLVRISDGFVAWEEWPFGSEYGGRRDIRGRNLNTGEDLAIATSDLPEYGMQLSNGIAVWIHMTREFDPPLGLYGPRDIYGKNLLTGEEFIIAATQAEETDPRISGSRVAWVSHDIPPKVTSSRLMVRDLSTGDEPATVAEYYPIPDEGRTDIIVNDLNGDRLVWHTLGGGLFNALYTARVGDAQPTEVAKGGVYGVYGADVAGNLMVYALDGIVYSLDTATGETRVLGQDAAYPVTDGRYVAWNGFHPESHGSWITHDMWAYDLLSDSRFDFGQIAGNPSVAPGLTMPVTGVATWSRYSSDLSGPYDIYAGDITWLLPSAPVPDTRPVDPGWTWYPQTSHYLQLGFKAFWEHNGGLPVFGYPLTEEFNELSRDTGDWYTVQLTERQRFEWHPENSNTPYEVLLGRLGAELLTRQGRDWKTFPTADPGAEHYFAETGHAIARGFWGYWSSHGLDMGDDGVSYRESLALFGYPLSEPMVETNADGDTVVTQYFERAVFEWHLNNPPEYQVLLRRLGAEELNERRWLPAPPSTDRIAYEVIMIDPVSGLSSPDIFVMRGDGTQQTNLTNHLAYDDQLQWSPDGTRLLFTSDRDSTSDMYVSSIYVMNADGTNLRFVHAGSAPAWSPDGPEIAFEADGDIFIIGVDGSGLRNLTNSPEPDGEPTWSPDGRRIAYVSQFLDMSSGMRHVIHVVERDGSNDKPLTLDLFGAVTPTWSPDGTRIAFYYGDEETYFDSLYLMDPDGSNKVDLTRCSGYNGCGGWAWSPDSTRLAVARDPTRYGYGDGVLVLVGADGTSEQVIATANHFASPSWSPDGSKLAFVRDGAIWKANVDGSYPRQLTAAGGNPVWAPRTGESVQAP